MTTPSVGGVQRARWVSGCLLFLPIFVLLVVPLLQRRYFFHEDLALYFYPLRGLLRQGWLQGQINGWNPYVSSGIPFLADIQVAAFYPANLFFYVLSPGDAFHAYFLFHFSLGTVLSLRFFRQVGYSEWAATLATLLYLWSGFFWAHLHHPTFVGAGIWLPAMLSGLRSLLVGSGTPARGMSVLALSVGMASLAGGSPQILYYELLTVIAYGIFLVITGLRDRSTGLRSGFLWAAGQTARTGAALSIGIGIGAVAQWPFLLATGERFRSHLSPLDFSVTHALSPLSLARLLVPNLFGNDFFPLSGVAYSGPGSYWENWCYLGLLGLGLTFVGIGRIGENRFFTGMLFLSLLGSLGKVGGIHFLGVTLLPLYDHFRAPSRLFMLTSFAAAFLAGGALHRATSEGSVLNAVPAPDAAYPDSDRVRKVARYLLVLSLEGLALVGLSLVMRKDPLHPVATCGLFLALLNLVLGWFWMRRIAERGWGNSVWNGQVLGFGAAALLLIDLLPVLATYNLPVDRTEVEAQPEIVGPILQYQGHSRLLVGEGVSAWYLNGGMEAGYRGLRGYNPLNSERLVAFLEASSGAAPGEGRIVAELPDPRAPMVDLLAPELVLAGRTHAPPGLQALFWTTDGRMGLFRDATALPRAWLSDRILQGQSSQEIGTRTRSVAGERPVPVVLRKGTGAVPRLQEGSARTSTVRFVTDLPDEVVLSGVSSGPQMLVLADIFAPGWSASLNGSPVEIHEAYGALRAVYLTDPGVFEVRFHYTTPGLIVGAWVTGVSLCAALAGLIWSHSVRSRNTDGHLRMP